MDQRRGRKSNRLSSKVWTETLVAYSKTLTRPIRKTMQREMAQSFESGY